ncbi:hypothetical protein SO802_020720 [Lithocarpus litseifolius]|uniref:Uncharacterized protein n=1 Tax=Lithocarpus litseifolius TaxID=425828 RepID=A0AAW2CGU7_9ROSI
MLKLFRFLQLDVKTLSVAIRFLRIKSLEQQAVVDLDTHYSEVNQAILELIKASEVSINPNEWTNLPKKKSGWIGPRVTLIRINTEGEKQYLYHALRSIKTEYFPVIPFWSHCFGI